ncbi:MAG: OmpA family protein [Bacteroidetes bacterium]|nr:OmpA family protein [Bacteroidota bacterium]
MKTTRRNAGAGILAALLMMAGRGTMNAQANEPQTGFRIGLLGGLNHNYVEAPAQRFINYPDDPLFAEQDYSRMNGNTAFGGIIGEYVFTQSLGLQLRGTYDDRTVSKTANGRSFTPHLSYCDIELGFRANVDQYFHVMLGPSAHINVTKKFDYSPDGSENVAAASGMELQNVKGSAYGIWGGFAYDIPIANPNESPRWYLTPFVEGSYVIDQKGADVAQSDLNRKWSTLTARAGFRMELGFGGGAETAMQAPAPAVDFTVQPPVLGVARPAERVEHLPLRNYIFFTAGSTNIPARYLQLTPGEAETYNEHSLPESVGTGGAASTALADRQMQVYHNVLNVVGSRMAKNPSAHIVLTGSAPEQAVGLQMAQHVKTYLAETFGIAPERIETNWRTRPEHASGTALTAREDRALVAEENLRVEIRSDAQDLLAPVELHMPQAVPVSSDLWINIRGMASIERWSVLIEGNGYSRTYGPFTVQEKAFNANEILGRLAAGHYSATVTATARDGQLATSTHSFDLKRRNTEATTHGAQTILFEFDDSKTSRMYETFLRKEVAPQITTESVVYIQGYSDIIGSSRHNTVLSMQRADNTEQILKEETKKLGRDALFVSYGFGEDEMESPQENDTPEGRYYNRMVVIEIESK